ncbi:MAG TPA: hypothetical protein VEB21_05025, partial [Terriglobales bacterium]|nr:hypothetical protein [Terriglobales bacterium]
MLAEIGGEDRIRKNQKLSLLSDLRGLRVIRAKSWPTAALAASGLLAAPAGVLAEHAVLAEIGEEDRIRKNQKLSFLSDLCGLRV